MPHTPGPWIYVSHEHSFYVFGPNMSMVADDSPDNGAIARMRGTGRGADEHEQEANARIIASAPDLLAASKAQMALIAEAQQLLSRYLEPLKGFNEQKLINRLLSLFDGPEERRVSALTSAAIKKAEGAE